MATVSPSVAAFRRSTAPAPAVRAVVFDLDGTLYAQRPLRLRMAAELAALFVARPVHGLRTMRLLKNYREAQEVLRSEATPYDREHQIAVAAARSGVDQGEAADVIQEWMFRRPLQFLPAYRARGLDSLLTALRNLGVELGVLSDYDAHDKLKALGVASFFSQVLCAADPDVRALKPNPRGLLLACARWRLDTSEAVMVGDRLDVDGAAAAAVHMKSIIVGRRPRDFADLRTTFISSLDQVPSVLDDCR